MANPIPQAKPLVGGLKSQGHLELDTPEGYGSLGRFLDRGGTEFNVLAFGADPSGVADSTEAVQAAVTAAQAVFRGRVRFPPGTYRLDLVRITGDVILDCTGATIHGIGITNRIFRVEADLDFCALLGGRFDYPHAAGKTNLHAFTIAEPYSVRRLIIRDNDFGNIRVVLNGPDTQAEVSNNRWFYNEKISSTEPLFLFNANSSDLPPDQTKRHCWFRANVMDGFCPDDQINAICKFTGQSSGVVMEGNTFRNRNPNVRASVDMYFGLNQARIRDNVFINVQLHRKQWGAIGGGAQGGFDLIDGNTFVLEEGFSLWMSGGPAAADGDDRFIYIHGSQWQIVNNSFIVLKTTGIATPIYMYPLNEEYDDSQVVGTWAGIVANNLVDFSRAPDGRFIRVGSSGGVNKWNRYIACNGNVVIGGRHFVQGAGAEEVRPWYWAITGNVWKAAEDAFHSPWGLGRNNVEAGNAWDVPPGTTINAVSSLLSRPIPTIDTSLGETAFDVTGMEVVRVTGTGEIKHLSGGRPGQILILYSTNNDGCTVRHFAAGGPDEHKIQLKYGADMVLKTPYTLTLVYTDLSKRWREVSRSGPQCRFMVDGWVVDEAAASIVAGLMPRTAGAWVVAKEGSIVGVTVQSSEARIAGTLRIEVYKNGAPTGLFATLDASNPQFRVVERQPHEVPVAAGDLITLHYTTSADWLPTTAKVQGSIEIDL